MSPSRDWNESTPRKTPRTVQQDPHRATHLGKVHTRRTYRGRGTRVMPDCLHAFQTAAREALTNHSHAPCVEPVACLFTARALASAPRPKDASDQTDGFGSHHATRPIAMVPHLSRLSYWGHAGLFTRFRDSRAAHLKRTRVPPLTRLITSLPQHSRPLPWGHPGLFTRL